LSSDGQRTEVSVAGRVFTAAVDAHTGNAGQAVHLGLRPEDMRLVADGQQPNTFHGTIAHIEKLGESSLLYIEPEGHTELVTLKVDGTTDQQTGTRVCVQIDPELLHLFNAQGDAYERTVKLPI
jgi:ABC-type sugar transport system ATPase subunit